MPEGEAATRTADMLNAVAIAAVRSGKKPTSWLMTHAFLLALIHERDRNGNYLVTGTSAPTLLGLPYEVGQPVSGELFELRASPR